MKHIVFTLALAGILAACGSGEPKAVEKSETIKQAEIAHDQSLAIGAEVVNMLHERIEGLNARVQFATETQDTLLLARYNALLADYEKYHTMYHDWEHNLAEIPGHEHTHDGAHDHAHDHDHNHAQDRIMEGLSDEEHLNIQKEQLRQIQEMKSAIEQIAAQP
jgi:hypothetical protein